MTWRNAIWILVAMGSALLIGALAVGCGGSGERCGFTVCAEDESCFGGECRATNMACEPECADGEQCLDGRCFAEDGRCDRQGQACPGSAFLEWHGDYLCLDWDPQSITPENATCSRDCRNQGCPQGSECMALGLGDAGACRGDSDCGQREMCLEGQCLMAVCRSSECAVDDAADADCGDDERCTQVGNELELCTPEGQQRPGERCIEAKRGFEEQRVDETCISDAVCLAGTCRAYCDEGDCGADGEQCVSIAAGDERGEVDVCAAACDFGAEDTGCGDDETCMPTGDHQGICEEAGSVEAFERCEVGGERCASGLICAGEQQGEALGRCLPVCHLGAGDASQSARDATCPQSDVNDGVLVVWHMAPSGQALDLYIEGSDGPVAEIEPGARLQWDGDDFWRRPADWIEWSVRKAGAPSTEAPIAEGQFELAAGESRLLALLPEAGRQRGLSSSAPRIDDVNQTQWVLGIPDVGTVDLWAVDASGQPEQWATGLGPGEVKAGDINAGTYELRLVPEGQSDDSAPIVEWRDVELSGEEQFVAFRGTADDGDVHSIVPPYRSTENLPDLEAEQSLAMTCRSVNDGVVGACLEVCEGEEGLVTDRCSGPDMGCASHLDEGQDQWVAACMPVGDADLGDSCEPEGARDCAGGLYCEEYGPEAFEQRTAPGGRCAPLCDRGDEQRCSSGQICRAFDGDAGMSVGQCRTTCEPGTDYRDEQCPTGQKSCVPESRLVRSAEGLSTAYDVDEQQPVCWASGTAGVGENCIPGECEPGSECLYPRSNRIGLAEGLLSPYLGTGTAGRECRAHCDPFTGDYSEHQCDDGQTCLFNYPFNANVGHCADIADDVGIGEPCDEPGQACGDDAICIADGSGSECMRFCQFVGPDLDGYAQSSCPMGLECRPFVSDVGLCD